MEYRINNNLYQNLINSVSVQCVYPFFYRTMDTSEALDLTKENIQPLKQGRKPAQLGTALQAQTNIDVYQQLLKQRE